MRILVQKNSFSQPNDYVNGTMKGSFKWWAQIIIRIALVLLIDFLISDFLPVAIFGTKDIGIFFDITLKKIPFVILFCSVFNSEKVVPYFINVVTFNNSKCGHTK